MKRILFVFLLLLSSIFSFSQSGLQTYNNFIFSLKDKGYHIDKEAYEFVKEGGYIYYEKIFYAGYVYIVSGLSIDDDVSDVNIFVYEEDGSLYKKDEDNNKIAGVIVNTSFTRKMFIKVVNFRSNTPDDESNCRIVIASKSAY